MSQEATPDKKPAGVTHDVAARLLGIAPGELQALVRDGHVRRADKNAYPLPALVGDYCAFLRAAPARSESAPTQAQAAAHLDLSDRSVREWETKLGLEAGRYSLTDIRIAYIRALREQAAGRATGEGGLDLAAERARLAKEQADRLAMANAVTRKELAPVRALEEVLAAAGARAARLLDTIPGIIRRREPSLSAETIAAIEREIAKVRNLAASLTLADLAADTPTADLGDDTATTADLGEQAQA